MPGDKRDLLLPTDAAGGCRMLGMPNAGKSTFIARYRQQNRKSRSDPFTTLVPSPGRGTYGQRKEFCGGRHSGLIGRRAEGAGLGIRFLKHLERCRVLLHLLIDIDPDRRFRSAENARTAIGELEKYS
ncbi:50S ribosome-binding GTPase [Salmonella enterica subsp. enterica]|nr:50S ribosome-binding GTPase [Salmonella enterica subsp. enterica]